MTLEQELQPYRDQIDQVDQQLIELVKRRLDAVKQIGIIKSKYQAPVYVPHREQALLQKNRALAEQAQISPQLIEDLLRRLIKESHSLEDSIMQLDTPHKICVVGGGSGIGKRFVTKFLQNDIKINVLEKDDWDHAAELLDVDLVIVAVPIHNTVEVIHRLQPYLNKQQILADFTSTKIDAVAAMLEVHQGPVLGLHPMFGPDICSFEKQVILISGGRDFAASEWLIRLFNSWKMVCEQIEPEQHDLYMSHIQAARHFNSFVIGKYIQSSNLDLDLLRKISSPIYYLEFSLIGRLFAQSPELYADIIFNSPANKDIIKSVFNEYQDAIKLIDQDDKQGFIDNFNHIKNHFGDQAQRFLDESARLIYASTHNRN